MDLQKELIDIFNEVHLIYLLNEYYRLNEFLYHDIDNTHKIYHININNKFAKMDINTEGHDIKMVRGNVMIYKEHDKLNDEYNKTDYIVVTNGDKQIKYEAAITEYETTEFDSNTYKYNNSFVIMFYEFCTICYDINNLKKLCEVDHIDCGNFIGFGKDYFIYSEAEDDDIIIVNIYTGEIRKTISVQEKIYSMCGDSIIRVGELGINILNILTDTNTDYKCKPGLCDVVLYNDRLIAYSKNKFYDITKDMSGKFLMQQSNAGNINITNDYIIVIDGNVIHLYDLINDKIIQCEIE